MPSHRGIIRFVALGAVVLGAVSRSAPARTQKKHNRRAVTTLPLSLIQDPQAARSRTAISLQDHSCARACPSRFRTARGAPVGSGRRTGIRRGHARHVGLAVRGIPTATVRRSRRQVRQRGRSVPSGCTRRACPSMSVDRPSTSEPTDADDWLIQHGSDYGLCQTYANEMWHF